MTNLKILSGTVGIVAFLICFSIIEITKPKIMMQYKSENKVNYIKSFWLSLLIGSLVSFCILISKRETTSIPFLN